MTAYIKIGDIQGESTDQGHESWILLDSMSSGIARTIPNGAIDQNRARGETSLGDINIQRTLDKSSVKIAESCATGKFFPSVEIHFCSTILGKQESYLKYKLSNVIITSYTFQGNKSGDPLPSESLSLGFTEIEWTYLILDPKTGEPKGNVPGKYNPGKGKGS